jgi:2-polyprenyl-6-methoxyphenol hydroxylase-like FAD-dependent oxidoreductase
MIRADVVIVGGGFAGLCAARALADGRRRIVVLEARTGTDPRFRGELMHPPAVEILSQLGLLEPLLDAGGVMVDGFAVVLADGKPPVTLPYSEIGDGAGKGFSMEHPKMVACFRREVAKDPGVTLRTGVRVSEVIHENGAVAGVRTDRGEEIRAPLTVVADGRHSKVRKALDFPEDTRLLSYTAAVLVDDGELPRPGHGHVFYGVGGPILAYPIDGGRVRMCLDIPLDTVKGKEAVNAYLRQHCAPHVPEPLRSGMLRAIEVRETEMCATHSIHTRRCTAPGVVLVGDSCGCSHPITAAGMMIALKDIRALAEELDKGGPLDAALVRYQNRRYEFVRAREILAEGLYDVFAGGDDGARAMRNGLFRYWTSGARARAASMSLLSGHESRLRAFIAEYLSVIGESAVSVLGGADAFEGLQQRRLSAHGLLRTAYRQLTRTAQLVYNDVQRRPPLPPRLAAMVQKHDLPARKQESAAAAAP